MGNHQKVSLELPSEELLKKIGAAVVVSTHLEHLLKIADKRTSNGSITLQDLENYKFSLGGLLNGVSDWAQTKKYAGLIEKAKTNPQLKSLNDELKNAADLVKMRNKYAHNGIAKDVEGNFIFIKSKDRGVSGEDNMIAELEKFITKIQDLITSIHSKISK